MKININDFVQVKLTNYGKQILENYEFGKEHLLKVLLGPDTVVTKVLPLENGNYRFQIWTLMEIFGPVQKMSLENSFVDNEIIYEKSYLQHSEEIEMITK